LRRLWTIRCNVDFDPVANNVSRHFFMLLADSKLVPDRPGTSSPQLRSRSASQPCRQCLELHSTGIQSATPQRNSPILNEEYNDSLDQRPASPGCYSAAPSASVTRAPTPSISPSQRMRKVSRTGVHPMLGAGLAIREAFGKYQTFNKDFKNQGLCLH
ncbi:hypothetical protein L9F63_013322, partial [Diploptera punctata]